MPFNGGVSSNTSLTWNHSRIIETIQQVHPSTRQVPSPINATAREYQIDGYVGRIGVIPAYSRTFCGTCNRIRLTAQGVIRTCLYNDGGVDFRRLLRTGCDDQQIADAFIDLISKRARDGFEAEKNRSNPNTISESMSSIGG